MNHSDWQAHGARMNGVRTNFLAFDIEAVLDPTTQAVWIDEFAGTPRGNAVSEALRWVRRDISVAIVSAKVRKLCGR